MKAKITIVITALMINAIPANAEDNCLYGISSDYNAVTKIATVTCSPYVAPTPERVNTIYNAEPLPSIRPNGEIYYPQTSATTVLISDTATAIAVIETATAVTNTTTATIKNVTVSDAYAEIMALLTKIFQLLAILNR